MTQLTRLLALVLIAGACSAALVSTSAAQTPEVRVFGSWLEPIKLHDGSETVHTFQIEYDYRSHETTMRRFDESGALVESVLMDRPPEPHPEEKIEAITLIQADPELASVIGRTDDAVIEGGFIYYEGACAQQRCLQFSIGPADGSQLTRFVIVELGDQRILERDLYPQLRN